ncbi:MAG: hypothetical protein JXB07_05690 [Anaerolineae bacterium]|nr:hypothetical protein [Anaerolineae bacterium]
MFGDTLMSTPSQEVADELRAWRIRLLDFLLVSSLVPGMFALYSVIVNAINDPALRPSATFYVVVYILVALLLLVRRVDISWRIAGYLVLVLALATSAMFVSGLVGSGRVLMMVAIALGTALFGWQVGVITSLFSLAVYIGIWIAVSQEYLTPLPATDSWWMSEGLTLVLGIAVLLVTVVSFGKAQQRGMERAQEAEVKLMAAQAQQWVLACNLHDETVQQMYGVILVLRRAIAVIQSNPEQSIARLKRALDLSIQAWYGLRDHLSQLGGATQPDKPSLATAMPRNGRSDLPGEMVPFDIQMILTRIIQESMSNVYRHSRATQIDVNMRVDKELVRINIRDNGIGFAPDGINKVGFGLTSLREQIGELGGTFIVQSATGIGTNLKVTVPLEVVDHE